MSQTLTTLSSPFSGRAFDRWLISGICFLIYLVTAPQAVTFEDAGIISILCAAESPMHPPGYPLYSMVCALTTKLPLWDDFKLLSLLSMLTTAGAVWLLHSLLQRIVSPAAAATSAFAFGTSLAIWSQAIIPEVYGPNLLAFMFVAVSLTRFADHSSLPRATVLALSAGLALSIHWPLILLAGLAIFLFSIQPLLKLYKRHGVLLSSLAISGGFLLGLSPYIWLALRLTDVGVSFNGPLPDPQDWLDYVLRKNYAESDKNFNAGLNDDLSYLSWLVFEISRQFGWIALPLILVGIWRAKQLFNRISYWTLWLLLLSQTFILSLLLDFEYDFFYQSIFQPYPLIGYSVLAVWFATGLDLAEKHLSQAARKVVFILLALSVPIGNLNDNNRRYDTIASQYAELLLNSTPRNGILIVDHDFDTGTAGYLHYLKGMRPDIELLQGKGLIFANRLYEPKDSKTLRNKKLFRYLAQVEKPVMLTYVPDKLPEGFYLQQRGLVWELKNEKSNTSHCAPLPEHIDFALYLLTLDKSQHPHVNRFINLAVAQMTHCLLNSSPKPRYASALKQLSEHPSASLLVLARLLQRTPENTNQHMINMVSQVLEEGLSSLTKQRQAIAHELLARALLQQTPHLTGIETKDQKRAEQHLLRSIDLWNIPEHYSRQLLYHLYYQTDKRQQAEDLIRQFPQDLALTKYVENYSLKQTGDAINNTKGTSGISQ